jgi:SAM-dependent methyltransferase
MWALDRTDAFRARFARADIRLRSCDLDRVSIPFEDRYFDYVLFAETLEHIFAPPTDVLREVLRIIKPGGRLLLTVPNIAIMKKRLGLLLGHNPLPDPDDRLKTHPTHGHGHVHEYTRNEIAAVCRRAGFQVVNLRMIWKSPSDILRMVCEGQGALLRRLALLAKLPHALLNSVVRTFRGNIVVECRRPSAAT